MPSWNIFDIQGVKDHVALGHVVLWNRLTVMLLNPEDAVQTPVWTLLSHKGSIMHFIEASVIRHSLHVKSCTESHQLEHEHIGYTESPRTFRPTPCYNSRNSNSLKYWTTRKTACIMSVHTIKLQPENKSSKWNKHWISWSYDNCPINAYAQFLFTTSQRYKVSRIYKYRSFASGLSRHCIASCLAKTTV